MIVFFYSGKILKVDFQGKQTSPLEWLEQDYLFISVLTLYGI